MIDDAWFALSTADARAAAAAWTDEPRRELALAALDAGRELRRDLVATIPSFRDNPVEAASLRLLEKFPGSRLPEVPGTYVSYIDCIPRVVDLNSTVDAASAAQLFVPTVTLARVTIESPPTKQLAKLLRATRVSPIDHAHGPAWVPVLAEMPKLAFVLSKLNPTEIFLRALDADRVALGDVRLALMHDHFDLDLVARVHDRCDRLVLRATDVPIGLAREVLDRVPDGFGDGRGVIAHGNGWTYVYTRFSRSTGPHGEFTRDGAVFVDDEQRVVWSSTDSPIFEHQGVRYEYVARDISRRISAH